MKIQSSIKDQLKLHQDIQKLEYWSHSRFETLNTIFKLHKHEKNDKDLVDNIIDIMIKKVMENRKHSKIAKEKFQQILENKCKEYRYDPVQKYCKICKRDDLMKMEL
ncbi:5511_t:CDS:2 [Gigaspora margarita]|uniref:5511_t:CDS:1 n=1 Tax=Gigaspora margarita TaxID=4874 RepID=A0ABM8VVS8_GIGMA|nr:5511_t:CDS:2 [Gigaspora margarita]